MPTLRLSALLLPPLLVAVQDPEPTPTAPIEVQTRALFDYEHDAPLDIVEVGFESTPGYTVADITFASPAGSTVPAYLFEPTSEGPHAGIVLMHGMPGDRTSMQRLAAQYAATGAVVLAISAPWARPDGPRERILQFTRQDRDEQIQLIQDLRRAVDLLESLTQVDPERLAYVGVSYGGAMGGLLAGVERRIKSYVLVVGDGGLVAHTEPPAGSPESLDPGMIAERKSWRAWMDPIEPIRFVAHAAPARLLFQNGRADRMVPAADATAYHAAGSEPKKVLWYDHGHVLSDALLADQVQWLAAEIGIDATKF